MNKNALGNVALIAVTVAPVLSGCMPPSEHSTNRPAPLELKQDSLQKINEILKEDFHLPAIINQPLSKEEEELLNRIKIHDPGTTETTEDGKKISVTLKRYQMTMNGKSIYTVIDSVDANSFAFSIAIIKDKNDKIKTYDELRIDRECITIIQMLRYFQIFSHIGIPPEQFGLAYAYISQRFIAEGHYINEYLRNFLYVQDIHRYKLPTNPNSAEGKLNTIYEALFQDNYTLPYGINMDEFKYSEWMRGIDLLYNKDVKQMDISPQTMLLEPTLPISDGGRLERMDYIDKITQQAPRTHIKFPPIT